MENNKLPIKEIFHESITLVKNNYKALFKAAILYIIIGLIINIYDYMYLDLENFVLDIPSLILTALLWFTFILTSVRFHRIFLLSEMDNSSFLKWSTIESKFFGRWIVIILSSGLIATPVLIIFSFFSISYGYEETDSILGIIMMIPMYYFISRFSLVLPATAINDKENSLKWSWNLSKGNAIRLFLLLTALPILPMAFFTFLPVLENIGYSLISIILTILILPFEICFLSLSYKFLMEAHNQNPEEEIINESSNDIIVNNSI